MKILIVTHYFLPHKGGIEFVAYNQAKELVKQGHKVTIVSSRIGNEPKESILDGIKIKRIKAWNWFEKKWGVPYPIFSPKLFSVLNKEAKDADIVHVHDLFYLSALAGAIASKKNKKPLVLMQHVKNVKHSKVIVNFIQWLVEKTYGNFIINSAKKILVCNEDVGNWINKPKKTNFIKNSVDIDFFKPTTIKNKKNLRKKYNIPSNKPVVLFVGRFVEVKGFQKLFETRNNDYFIVFIGDGEIKDSMRKDENTLFLNSIEQTELRDFYKLSDIFCLPSSSEGFPLTVLEAMSSGLPIIASDLSIYRKHFDVKNMLIIKPKVNEIRRAIKKLISDEKLYSKMKSYSRKEVTKKFGWDKNAKQLSKIYKEVLNEKQKNKK